MSRKNVVGNIKFSHFDDLFGEPDSVRESDIVEIPLTELYGFKNHPFKIRSDEELSEMIDSVRKYGVLVPGIARERKKGRYEIVAGHTRKHICELVGIKTMPMVIREMDDNEACLVMVDSNLQREHILPSEKAMAYRMKYDALKNQGLPGNSLKYLEKENKENYKKQNEVPIRIMRSKIALHAHFHSFSSIFLESITKCRQTSFFLIISMST